ncbi:uncharacterized protein TNCV_2733911 [Trichonephila clavipes]|nr:uncharacterized protein TNCV_2733911 [Trichonephila clavipes]
MERTVTFPRISKKRLAVVGWSGEASSCGSPHTPPYLFKRQCDGLRFLPESVARVTAIVGDPRCHTPRHEFKETLGVFLGYSRQSSFHTLPKLIWCGSWGVI